MAKQDDWVRMQLRLPKDLHARLTELAGPRSLNATIVERLRLKDYREAKAEQRRAHFRLKLDAGETPMTYEQVQAYVSAAIDAFPGGFSSINIEVVTKEIADKAEANLARTQAAADAYIRETVPDYQPVDYGPADLEQFVKSGGAPKGEPES